MTPYNLNYENPNGEQKLALEIYKEKFNVWPYFNGIFHPKNHFFVFQLMNVMDKYQLIIVRFK